MPLLLNSPLAGERGRRHVEDYITGARERMNISDYLDQVRAKYASGQRARALGEVGKMILLAAVAEIVFTIAPCPPLSRPL